jgi:alpha-glucosidase (family GH31 glycosyl hydrolase)
MRAHGHIDYYDREPYLQSERVQTVIRDAINLRYDLIHYLYGLFQEAHNEGTPIMRPLWYEFPHDTANNISEIFMWGPSLLYAPKISYPEFCQDYKLPPCE